MEQTVLYRRIADMREALNDACVGPFAVLRPDERRALFLALVTAPRPHPDGLSDLLQGLDDEMKRRGERVSVTDLCAAAEKLRPQLDLVQTVTEVARATLHLAKVLQEKHGPRDDD